MKSRTAQGFTLVELLVVVTIILLMSASLLPSFSSYIQAQDLKKAQELLKSDIRSIQNKAMTGVSSQEAIGSNKAEFWGIRFAVNSNTYEFFISDVNNSCPSGSIPSSQLKGTGFLGANVVIRSTSSGFRCMYFVIDEGNISQAGGLSSPIYVGYSGGPCRQVSYNSQGLIYNNNDNVCP